MERDSRFVVPGEVIVRVAFYPRYGLGCEVKRRIWPKGVIARVVVVVERAAMYCVLGIVVARIAVRDRERPSARCGKQKENKSTG